MTVLKMFRDGIEKKLKRASESREKKFSGEGPTDIEEHDKLVSSGP
jgi:hypothetical protein